MKKIIRRLSGRDKKGSKPKIVRSESWEQIDRVMDDRTAHSAVLVSKDEKEQESELSAYRDISKMYLHNQALSAFVWSAHTPSPTEPPSPPSVIPIKYEPQPGDEVITQFGRGIVDEVRKKRKEGDENLVVVKTTQWQMAGNQPATLYLQAGVIAQANDGESGSVSSKLLQEARALRRSAVALCGQQEYGRAQATYARAITLLEGAGEGQRTSALELLIPSYNDMAWCSLQLSEHSGGLADCAHAAQLAASALRLADDMWANEGGDAAVANLDRVKLSVQWPVASLTVLGEALLKKGEYHAAATYLERGVRLAEEPGGGGKPVLKRLQKLLHKAQAESRGVHQGEEEQWTKEGNQKVEVLSQPIKQEKKKGTAASSTKTTNLEKEEKEVVSKKGNDVRQQLFFPQTSPSVEDSKSFWTTDRKRIGMGLLVAGFGIGLAFFLNKGSTRRKEDNLASSSKYLEVMQGVDVRAG